MVLWWLIWAACEPATPCDRYADYMCRCHADDVDCDELLGALSEADADLQAACLDDLSAQQDADDAAGLSCE